MYTTHRCHTYLSCFMMSTPQNTFGDVICRILSHPPYSPDSAPCDLYLYMKEKLLGNPFTDAQEAMAALQGAIKESPRKSGQKFISVAPSGSNVLTSMDTIFKNNNKNTILLVCFVFDVFRTFNVTLVFICRLVLECCSFGDIENLLVFLVLLTNLV